MRRGYGLLVGALAAAVTLSAVLVGATEAAFTTHSDSHIAITADRVQNWLHLYSQSTDPDGLTNYATRIPTGEPAAAGLDETLTVDLGILGPGSTTFNRVFTLTTPLSLPQGGPVTVSAYVLADEVSGLQPVTRIGFSAIGTGGSFTNPITMSANSKRQLNLRVQPRERLTTYQLTIRLTLTYPGFSSAYYQYFVPLTVERD